MTAVDWLIQQLVELDKQLDGRRKNDDATVIKLNPTKIYEQAKQMETREYALFLRWILKHYSTKVTDEGMFGWVNSMGEDVDIEDIVKHYKKTNDHIVEINEMVSSQTEISDEEIEKAIIDQDVVKQEGYCHCFLEGAKWYREQLKSKQ